MSRRYPIQWPGGDGWSKWVPVGKNLTTDRCCDCKLVHEHQYRKRRSDGWIVMRSRRNNRKTAASRRAFGITIRRKRA